MHRKGISIELILAMHLYIPQPAMAVGNKTYQEVSQTYYEIVSEENVDHANTFLMPIVLGNKQQRSCGLLFRTD